jgi:hypothetical protein
MILKMEEMEKHISNYDGLNFILLMKLNMLERDR